MTNRIALALSVLALAVAVMALVVATSDSSEDAEAPVPAEQAAPSAGLQTETPVADTAVSGTVITVPEPAPTAPDSIAPTTEAPVSEPPTPSVSLPGEPFEFGPAPGDVLGVVGVGYDDVLNVRDVPFGQIVDTLDPLESGIVAVGQSRALPATVWHEVRVGASTGWVSDAYVAPLGATFDATTEVVNILGETPAAGTMPELGRIVAEAVASDDPPSRIAVSTPTVIGDLGEITMDVVDLADDSLRGLRLHVFAHLGAGTEPFVLKSVEQTLMCYPHRGVSEGGLCN